MPTGTANKTMASSVLTRPVVVGVSVDNRSDHAVCFGLDLASRFGWPGKRCHRLDNRGPFREGFRCQVSGVYVPGT